MNLDDSIKAEIAWLSQPTAEALLESLHYAAEQMLIAEREADIAQMAAHDAELAYERARAKYEAAAKARRESDR